MVCLPSTPRTAWASPPSTPPARSISSLSTSYRKTSGTSFRSLLSGKTTAASAFGRQTPKKRRALSLTAKPGTCCSDCGLAAILIAPLQRKTTLTGEVWEERGFTFQGFMFHATAKPPRQDRSLLHRVKMSRRPAKFSNGISADELGEQPDTR